MAAMDVSPKTLREVEFREKMRGYHPEDVDHFLEEVAAGLEVLQERLRQAVERAQRAEAAAAEAGGSDETLRKTLVLAQRTADMAVQEAREQAARILAGAEQQAQAILADAEERGRRTLEDAIAECRAELAALETARAQAQQDVDTLNRWLEEHKAHLQETLTEAIAVVERAGVLWPAPSTRPADYPGAAASRPAARPRVRRRRLNPSRLRSRDGDVESRRRRAARARCRPDRRAQAGAGASAPPSARRHWWTPATPIGQRPTRRQALDDFFDDGEELARTGASPAGCDEALSTRPGRARGCPAMLPRLTGALVVAGLGLLLAGAGSRTPWPWSTSPSCARRWPD